MNGKDLEPAMILTHYESDFGAAPKVQMRKGQVVTVLNPDFAGRRRAFPRCFVSRSKTAGVTYGNYLREVSYAVKKAGLCQNGLPISDFQFSIGNHKLVVSLSNPSKISVTVNFSVLLCALVGLNCPQYIPL